MRDSAYTVGRSVNLNNGVGEELMRDSALKLLQRNVVRAKFAESEKSSCATAL